MRGGKKLILAAAGATIVAGATATTTTTTTTTTSTTPTTTSTTVSPTTTTTPTVTIPAGYTLVLASTFGVKCDGITDDTAALQKAFNGVTSYQALQLPAGSCLTSTHLSLYGKSNVAVIGAGKDSTIIQATNPLDSALVVSSSTNVLVQGLQVYSPTATSRTDFANSRGFYVEKSSGITFDGIKVHKTSGGGIVFYIVQDSKILNSEVLDNFSDAFHVTGASRNILVQGNTAKGSGDDCFASIGYGTDLNRNIQFLDNSCSDGKASGISFEGTIGGQAHRNKITRTGVAGIRIASISGWNTGIVSDIDLQNNVLTEVKTRTDVDHAAIMVFTDKASVQNVSIANTTITNPHTYTGARILNYVTGTATVSNVNISNTVFQSADFAVKQCFGLSTGISGTTLAQNYLNSAACEAH